MAGDTFKPLKSGEPLKQRITQLSWFDSMARLCGLMPKVHDPDFFQNVSTMLMLLERTDRHWKTKLNR